MHMNLWVKHWKWFTFYAMYFPNFYPHDSKSTYSCFCVINRSHIVIFPIPILYGTSLMQNFTENILMWKKTKGSIFCYETIVWCLGHVINIPKMLIEYIKEQ